jgi:hypothetical protein
LVPLSYNDGSPVPRAVFAEIENCLFERFGGYTVVGTVVGAYRMADRTRVEERSLMISVAVPEERVADLRRRVAGFARQLRQESMYFEVSDATVELVRPEE